MGEDRDVTLPNGISIVERGGEVTYTLPPQWSFDIWSMIVALPLFLLLGWHKLATVEPWDRDVMYLWIGAVAAGLVFCIDMLTRRYRMVFTEREVTLRSAGVLGVHNYACARSEFRVGDFSPRGRYGRTSRSYRWGHLNLLFGKKFVRTMRGWDAQLFDTIEDWRRLERPRDRLTTPRAGSRLLIFSDKHEKAIEVRRPVGNSALWLGALVPFVFAALIGFNIRPQDVDAAFGLALGAVGIILLILFVLSANLLSARSRISITKKYVAMTSRTLLGSTSYTCARDDFTIGSVEVVLAVVGLRLNFASESTLAMLGSLSPDVHEASELLVAWMTEPTSES